MSYSPDELWSNCTPWPIKSLILSDASVITLRTTASSHSPEPAFSVSLTCDSKPSRSLESSTPAIPPCAQFVDDIETSFLVTTATLRPDLAHSTARNSPAMPEPITATSTCSRFTSPCSSLTRYPRGPTLESSPLPILHGAWGNASEPLCRTRGSLNIDRHKGREVLTGVGEKFSRY